MTLIPDYDDLVLPYATADLPGVGGEIKKYDEDFVVEEIPRYAASGTGTHVYALIEKRGLTTHAAIRDIASALKKKTSDIGYAGLKDAHGVTRQMISVEHVDPAELKQLSLPRVKVVAIGKHTNKIKLGHLSGNRFIIRIRNTTDHPQPGATAVMDRLTKGGVPNYFGPQRFGVRGDNAGIGTAILRGDFDEAMAVMLGRPKPSDRDDIQHARKHFDCGDYHAAASAWPRGFGQQARICRALAGGEGQAKKAWRIVDHSLRKLYVSAVQSALFNQVLAQRIGDIATVCSGDIAWIHRNGACFAVEDADAEQPRCDRFEISPSGPLFGRKMKDATGTPGQIETDILTASGLSREQLRPKDGTKLDGARRPLRVPLADPSVAQGQDDRGPYVQLAFSLPPGAYATCVTREVCKNG